MPHPFRKLQHDVAWLRIKITVQMKMPFSWQIELYFWHSRLIIHKHIFLNRAKFCMIDWINHSCGWLHQVNSKQTNTRGKFNGTRARKSLYIPEYFCKYIWPLNDDENVLWNFLTFTSSGEQNRLLPKGLIVYKWEHYDKFKF